GCRPWVSKSGRAQNFRRGAFAPLAVSVDVPAGPGSGGGGRQNLPPPAEEGGRDALHRNGWCGRLHQSLGIVGEARPGAFTRRAILVQFLTVEQSKDIVSTHRQ